MPPLNIRARAPRSTQAFIDPSVTAGVGPAAAELGSAVIGLGLQLGEKQRRRNAELAKTDLATMQAATDAGRNEFLRSLRTTDESYNEINARWQKESKKLYKTIGQTSRQREAQRKYGQWVKRIKTDLDKDIDNIAWGVSVPRAKAQLGNAAAETLRTNPDFAEGLLIANQDIEASTLLTSEEKDLTLANAIIDTNPQWYIDNKDSDMGKEIFGLLSIDQKRALETKANESINRIRTDQQRARTELNNETRKDASDRLRSNNLTSDWLQANRPNMAAPDYERYNKHLISIAEKEDAFQKNLRKIEDPFNRQIFGGLDSARDNEQLDALQNKVNLWVSPEQRKLSVEEGKKWTTKINAKREEVSTDLRVKSDLIEMANDIAIGAVTKDDTEDAINRATDINQTITEKDRSELLQLIDIEHTSYQSTAMREAYRYGAGQLISVTQSLLDTLLAAGVVIDIKTATKRRELELWNDAEYKKALNDWLAKNPEANGDDIYIQSRKLITQYRRPLQEIESARERFEQRITAKPQPTEQPPAKFANPVRVVDPDGVKGWSSEELFKSTLEPLGFKKIDQSAQNIEVGARRGGTLRADNTEKGLGFFGELTIPGGGVTTEFSIGIEFDGKETEIPTLVPTLSKEELLLMITDIIPNNKKVPDSIVKKATAHARKRIREGKSPFAQNGEQ